jgi:hypothetical protein
MKKILIIFIVFLFGVALFQTIDNISEVNSQTYQLHVAKIDSNGIVDYSISIDNLSPSIQSLFTGDSLYTLYAYVAADSPKVNNLRLFAELDSVKINNLRKAAEADSGNYNTAYTYSQTLRDSGDVANGALAYDDLSTSIINSWKRDIADTSTVIRTAVRNVSGQSLVLSQNFNAGSVSGTTVLDGSTYNNHGTVTGATWSETGGFNGGGVYSFDGTGDYINCGLGTDMNFGTGDFSISAWIVGTTPASVQTQIVNKGSVGGGGKRYSLQIVSDNTIKWEIDDDANPASVAAAYDSATWVHVVATKSASWLKLYFDGVIQDSTDCSSTVSIDDATKPLAIGVRSNDLTSDVFIGEIDNVMLFGRELSAQEASRLYYQRVEGLDAFTPAKSVREGSNGTIYNFGKTAIVNNSDSLTIDHDGTNSTLESSDGIISLKNILGLNRISVATAMADTADFVGGEMFFSTGDTLYIWSSDYTWNVVFGK